MVRGRPATTDRADEDVVEDRLDHADEAGAARRVGRRGQPGGDHQGPIGLREREQPPELPEVLAHAGPEARHPRDPEGALGRSASPAERGGTCMGVAGRAMTSSPCQSSSIVGPWIYNPRDWQPEKQLDRPDGRRRRGGGGGALAILLRPPRMAFFEYGAGPPPALKLRSLARRARCGRCYPTPHPSPPATDQRAGLVDETCTSPASTAPGKPSRQVIFLPSE